MAKPKMTATERRQLSAQTAIDAIADSDDSPAEKVHQLARVAAYASRRLVDVQDAMEGDEP